MFREMKAEDALKEYVKGRKVVLMEVVRMPDETDQYQGTELADVFRDSVFLVDLPDDPEPKREKAVAGGGITGKKKWFLNAEDKDRVREKYLQGMEMEDISKKLNLGLTAISRYIDEDGLGKERYKDQPVPSKGSAPIPSVSALMKK